MNVPNILKNNLKLGILFFAFAILLLFSFSHPVRLAVIQSAPRSLNIEFWDFWIQSRAIFFLSLLTLFIFLQRFSLDFLKNKNAPFAFYAILLILFHQNFFMIFFKDDLHYIEVFNNGNIIEWVIHRYHNWSSRIFIDFMNVIFTGFPYWLWKTLNILSLLYLFFGLNKLLNPQNKISNAWLLVLILTIYPFYQLGSAGWIATACNYVYPLTGIVCIFCFFQKIYLSQKTTNLDYFSLFLGFLFATSQEQSALILLIILISFLFFCKKNKKIILFLLFLNILFLCSMFFAPGNYLRVQAETRIWFPEFATFGIAEKISLGLLTTAAIFLKDKILIFVLSFFIFILTFKNFQEKYLRILATMQLLLCLFLSTFDNFLASFFDILKSIYHLIHPKVAVVPELSFIFILTLTLIVIWFLIIFYLNLKILKNNYIFLFILILGFFSKAIMGFSPTVYGSDDRTAIFAYLAMIALIYHLIQMTLKDFPRMLKSIFVVLIVFSFASTLDSLEKMYGGLPVLQLSYVDRILLFLCALFLIIKTNKDIFPRSTQNNFQKNI